MNKWMTMRISMRACRSAGFFFFIIFFYAALFAVHGMAGAGELSGTLSKGHSASFEDFLCDVFEFTPKASGVPLIAVLPADFDAYLILIGPDGTILTNDDHAAVLKLPSQPAGKWTAIATTLLPASHGNYKLVFDDVENLRQLDARTVDPVLLSRAFSEGRRVETSADRERARQNEIERLSDQLTLESFRTDLREDLIKNMNKNENSELDSKRPLMQLEERERQLLASLDEIRKLRNNRDFITQLVKSELTTVKSNIDKLANEAANTLSIAEASRNALQGLDRLDSISKEIAQANIELLHSRARNDVSRAQSDIERLQKLRAELTRALAEKLVDSRIVEIVRFGLLMRWHLLQDFAYSRESGSGVSEFIAEPFAVAMASAIGANGYASRAQTNPSVWLPPFLPWPPPDASAHSLIDRRLLVSAGHESIRLGMLTIF